MKNLDHQNSRRYTRFLYLLYPLSQEFDSHLVKLSSTKNLETCSFLLPQYKFIIILLVKIKFGSVRRFCFKPVTLAKHSFNQPLNVSLKSHTTN